MKYKLNEKIAGYEHEAEHVFETDEYGDMKIDSRYLPPIITALLIEKGVLSEVPEDDGLGWLPNKGDKCFYPAVYSERMTCDTFWDNDDLDNNRRKNTGVYKTSEEAIEVAKRMLKAVRG